ncbi:ABC transporter permease subunit [Thermococcus sp. GR6]|uniref:ABC transporter permease subunit n=1 Tax=Thermococcus sp. GR6 TaxID=1638256 RepID=UPI00143037E2|nr:ABC transporter permease subunit [Thermococcus sp. GR6]NJE42407.1 ABC transporter permease [Thermococcus sp. GR6]
MWWGFQLEFKQSLRTKKLWVILGIMALLYIPVFYIMKSMGAQDFTVEAAMTFLIQFVTGMAGFFIGILALLMGATAINSEIEKGTLRVAMSKPIKRLSYIGGKFLAHAVVLFIALLLSTLIGVLGVVYLGVPLSGQLVTDVLLLNMLLLLAMLQLVALGYILSTLIKSSSSALGVALVLVFVLFLIMPNIVGYLVFKEMMGNPDMSMSDVKQLQKDYTTKYLFYVPTSQVGVITGDVGTTIDEGAENPEYRGMAYAISHNLVNFGIIVGMTLLYLIVGFYRFSRMDLR